MSRHDDQVSLGDMLSHARDRVLHLALTRLVEIIGEAANRVSSDTQKKHPEVPWPKIIGMRNRLVHGYDVIDFDLLWDTVTTDLPPLMNALKGIVEER